MAPRTKANKRRQRDVRERYTFGGRDALCLYCWCPRTKKDREDLDLYPQTTFLNACLFSLLLRLHFTKGPFLVGRHVHVGRPRHRHLFHHFFRRRLRRSQ